MHEILWIDGWLMAAGSSSDRVPLRGLAA